MLWVHDHVHFRQGEVFELGNQLLQCLQLNSCDIHHVLLEVLQLCWRLKMNENVCKYQSRCWKQFESIAFGDFFVIYNFLCLFVTLISTSWAFPLVHGLYALLSKLGVFRFTCFAKKREENGGLGGSPFMKKFQKNLFFTNDDFLKKQISVAFLNLII